MPTKKTVSPDLEPELINPSAPDTSENKSVNPAEKKKGVLYFLFSPETRMGRFMRPFVRTLGIIVTLFAFGFFTAYIVLYQPRVKEMNQARTELKTVTERLNQTEGTLTAAQKFLTETNDKYEKAAADLAVEKDHSSLLALLAEVNHARASLSAKEGASARIILQNARKLLDAYLPTVKAHSAEMAKTFDTRMTLIQDEFSRDPETALADLELLAENLQDLEKVLYK